MIMVMSVTACLTLLFFFMFMLNFNTIDMIAIGETIQNVVPATSAIMLSILLTMIKQPHDALLCLVATFISVVFMFMMTKLEFIAMSFLMVYIGAIAILFLFVIMLFNIVEIFMESSNNLSTVLVLLTSMYAIIMYIQNCLGSVELLVLNSIDNLHVAKLYLSVIFQPEIFMITKEYYNFFWDIFLTAGWTLVVAMVGAIAMTLSVA